FDDLDVITGQGTITMEIIQELPTVDYILVPIGGGGLIAGVATLAKMLNPKIKVVGVEPVEAASMKAALAAGKVVTLPSANTIADGTAVKAVGVQNLPYVQENVDDILTVPDDELIGAFLDMVENHKMVVENSGLLTVAALKQLDLKGKKVVAVLSGGNMDVITMSSIVQHGLIQRDRIFSVSVLLPDKPGELVRVAQTIADAQGNVIKLEHNQFVSTNRNAAVELRITMEAFGTEHKQELLKALEDHGFRPKQIGAKLY
ncbi:MAG: pyridoxal-phosphate dependent enzyme, partial [Lachnospiraceae bacterium]